MSTRIRFALAFFSSNKTSFLFSCAISVIVIMTALLNIYLSHIVAKVLLGVIMGCTATLIIQNVLKSPNSVWTPWKSHRTRIGVALWIYALWFWILCASLDRGSFGTIAIKIWLKESGFGILIFLIILLGLYMEIGGVVDELLSRNWRFLILGVIATTIFYVHIIALSSVFFSSDTIFMASYAVSKLASSLAFGAILKKYASGDWAILTKYLLMINLLTLPVAIFLSS